ncbi:unnamed protein product [Chrysodeixis includens]|uniref:Uncharacterized protein n=1 Tax=Chrysodeixis includens TaxID=689277 RepID=A0A9N8L451_CHRIL|nr:unnamed protein product [Chrysodeixis includens]
MKILFKIISAVLYFNSVSPVLMYYIYDDNPNIGFVALDNGIGAYAKPGFTANSKKQFTGSYNSKYLKINNEHVVDSHFKVMKTPLRYASSPILDSGRIRGYDPGSSQNIGQRIPEEYRNTETPKQWHQRNQHQQLIAKPANNGHQVQQQHTQTLNNTPIRGEYTNKNQEPPLAQSNQQLPPLRPKAVNADYGPQIKQRNQRNKDEGFESKPSFVQMNVKKTQISTDPQKRVRLSNNRQLTSLTMHGPQESRQRIPTSMMMDKTLHKVNGLHDHNMQVMTRVLDDMTQKIADRRHKKGEYRKRDTKALTNVMFEKSKRSVVSDNMRKYIGKDIVKEHRSNFDVARIGSHEESLEMNDTPYALFYRMNPETLDQQEGYMMGSIEELSGEFSSKEKRLSEGFNDEVDMNVAQKSKNINTLKMRKKVKNFSNFKNH